MNSVKPLELEILQDTDHFTMIRGRKYLDTLSNPPEYEEVTFTSGEPGEVYTINNISLKKAGDQQWRFTGSPKEGKSQPLSDPKAPFIAESKRQLQCHLDHLKVKPDPTTFDGTLYRSINIKSEMPPIKANVLKISDHALTQHWGRYDVKDRNEGALYFSKTLEGNKTEMLPYGPWQSFNTYEFENITLDNLLDLTNGDIIERLGVTKEDLIASVNSESFDKSEIATNQDKTYNYEFTNVIGSWARDKKYKGIIAYGARGQKDYVNVIVFNEVDVKKAFKNPTLKPLTK